MPTVKKQQMVAELTTLLGASSSAIVTDYRGLTVADIAAVRRSLRERGITYRVIKNRLARIAAREAGLTELDELLEGPSALAIGDVDEIVLARSFLEAVRPYRTVTVRGGLLRGRRIESAAVDRLATLPGRDVLLGQLAGSMVAPLSAMASLLSAPLRNLGYALQQVATQKADAAPAAPAPATAPEASGATSAPAASTAKRAESAAPTTGTAEPVESTARAEPTEEGTDSATATASTGSVEAAASAEAAEPAEQAEPAASAEQAEAAASAEQGEPQTESTDSAEPQTKQA
jgi:large subunit ribosomal protein L10